MAEKYNPIEEEESLDMACEPLGGSAVMAADDAMGYLPSDLVNKAALIALIEKREGRLVS